jgi:hypothetical protein
LFTVASAIGLILRSAPDTCVRAHVAVHKIDIAAAKSSDFVAVQQKTGKDQKIYI